MSSKPIKLAILVSHPIQYFVPVYREIAASGSIDLTVLFRTRVGVDAYHDLGFGQTIAWDIPLLTGYRSYFLSRKTSLNRVEPSVIFWLIKNRPEALLMHGYNQATNLLALAGAKLLGIKVMMRGDTRLVRSGVTPVWKSACKRWLFHWVDGFITIGSANAAYYKALGVPGEKLHFAPFAVCNSFFSLTGEKRRSARCAMRTSLGVPNEAVVVLFASKLVERKRASDLLAAFRMIEAQLPGAWLWIVGSGPEEATLRQSALGMTRVKFCGFQNQSELPNFFAAADVFVLPSGEEPWGLVVNEAMAAGLPIVVTDDVGAALDLVEGKDTGFIYPLGNVDLLSNVLRHVITSPELRTRMAHNAETLIGAWDEKHSAAGIIRAVRNCLHPVRASA